MGVSTEARLLAGLGSTSTTISSYSLAILALLARNFLLGEMLFLA
jgi:hypothetical protein